MRGLQLGFGPEGWGFKGDHSASERSVRSLGRPHPRETGASNKPPPLAYSDAHHPPQRPALKGTSISPATSEMSKAANNPVISSIILLTSPRSDNLFLTVTLSGGPETSLEQIPDRGGIEGPTPKVGLEHMPERVGVQSCQQTRYQLQHLL
jgi:hypothetical protein